MGKSPPRFSLWMDVFLMIVRRKGIVFMQAVHYWRIRWVSKDRQSDGKVWLVGWVTFLALLKVNFRELYYL
jgi:hypothetical protein